jgi:hypothetical protein
MAISVEKVLKGTTLKKYHTRALDVRKLNPVTYSNK